MNVKIMGAEAVRREWREVVDAVVAGTDVLVERYSKRAVAVIPYEDYVALQEELEDLRAARRAEAVLAAWRRDPSTTIPWEQAKTELRDEGLLDEE